MRNEIRRLCFILNMRVYRTVLQGNQTGYCRNNMPVISIVISECNSQKQRMTMYIKNEMHFGGTAKFISDLLIENKLCHVNVSLCRTNPVTA